MSVGQRPEPPSHLGSRIISPTFISPNPSRPPPLCKSPGQTFRSRHSLVLTLNFSSPFDYSSPLLIPSALALNLRRSRPISCPNGNGRLQTIFVTSPILFPHRISTLPLHITSLTFPTLLFPKNVPWGHRMIVDEGGGRDHGRAPWSRWVCFPIFPFPNVLCDEFCYINILTLCVIGNSKASLKMPTGFAPDDMMTTTSTTTIPMKPRKI